MASRRWSCWCLSSSVSLARTIPPQVAQKLLAGTDARWLAADSTVNVDEDALADAEQEVMFEVQAAVDADEQKRFERASQQAERYIEDRLLVLGAGGRDWKSGSSKPGRAAMAPPGPKRARRPSAPC